MYNNIRYSTLINKTNICNFCNVKGYCHYYRKMSKTLWLIAIVQNIKLVLYGCFVRSLSLIKWIVVLTIYNVILFMNVRPTKLYIQLYCCGLGARYYVDTLYMYLCDINFFYAIYLCFCTIVYIYDT